MPMGIAARPFTPCLRLYRRIPVEVAMSSDALNVESFQSGELPVEELLRRVRPLPPYEESVIADLTEDEERAFLAAIDA